jgi:hypothetical protein
VLTTGLVTDTNVIRVAWEGALTPEEIADLRHQIGFVANLYGEARLLVEVRDGGPGPAEVREGLTALDDAPALDRVALVADDGRGRLVAELAGSVTVTDVAVFPAGREVAAVAWACA